MVTDNHYRWDFIGLSTDTKPTPSTSSKVSDGSTFYCSDNSKLYVWYKTQWYERTAPSSGSSYTAGDGIVIENDEISADLAQTTGESTTKLMSQKAITDALASIGGGVKELTSADYNYPTNNPDGVAMWLLPDGMYKDNTTVGLLYPDKNASKTLFQFFIKYSNSTDSVMIYYDGAAHVWKYWQTKTDTGARVGLGRLSPNVVQTTGTSTTDVMSQNAVTSMVFADPADKTKVKIGDSNTFIDGSATDGVVIGASAKNYGSLGVCIGQSAIVNYPRSICLGAKTTANGQFSVALGTGATTSAQGEINVGTGSLYPTNGYNSSNYRLLSGLYDGQSAHDAVTVGQLNTRLGNLTITTISQSDYNNLQTKDPNTLYLITGA